MVEPNIYYKNIFCISFRLKSFSLSFNFFHFWIPRCLLFHCFFFVVISVFHNTSRFRWYVFSSHIMVDWISFFIDESNFSSLSYLHIATCINLSDIETCASSFISWFIDLSYSLINLETVPDYEFCVFNLFSWIYTV